MQREKIQALQDLRSRLVEMASNAASGALGSASDKASLRSAIEARVIQDTPTA